MANLPEIPRQSSPPVIDDLGNTIKYLLSGALLHQASVTLTDAQIKALPTTPVVVIPATETVDYEGTPARVPVLVAAYLLTNYWPTAYADVSTGGLKLWIGSDLGSFIVARETVGTVLSSGNVDLVVLTIDTDPGTLYSNVFDNAIVLSGDSGWSALTGGNAANTLTVIVLYTVLDVTTGLFV